MEARKGVVGGETRRTNQSNRQTDRLTMSKRSSSMIIIINQDGARCSGCNEYLGEDEVEERCERCDKDLDDDEGSNSTTITFSYPLYERRGEKYLAKMMEGIVDHRIYTLTFKSQCFNFKAMPNQTGVEVKLEIQRRVRKYDGLST